ncbi:MAG: EF-P beta-lysylation protein EpmB [Planctomycetes bacterium]|nr:EF-P beta-lysylation protein EpmB [Planctomycetota bacterium]
MLSAIEFSGREAVSPAAWKKALATAVRDPDDLIDRLGLPEGLREGARRAARRFGLVVPLGFLDRMRPGDPDDPLLRQVLPLGIEEDEAEGFVEDPVGDREAVLLPGLIQKYEGRVLLVAAGSCAVNCRYCFRREFPYGETPRGLEAWRPALDRIAADPTLSEVILSGGDPLVLSDAALEALVAALAEVPHLARLRVHTRLPIVIPERVTEGLIACLRGTRLAPFVVVHANHAAEIAGACAEALTRLVDAGVPVLNQSVLLRGVNDDASTLVRLSERLLELRVLPYYLHQLDPVRGAAHFRVSEERGRELVEELRRRLPGYAVPRYVREVPGAGSKVPL